MMEQDLLDTDEKKIAVAGLLDTGAEVIITPTIRHWKHWASPGRN